MIFYFVEVRDGAEWEKFDEFPQSKDVAEQMVWDLTHKYGREARLSLTAKNEYELAEQLLGRIDPQDLLDLVESANSAEMLKLTEGPELEILVYLLNRYSPGYLIENFTWEKNDKVLY